MVPIDHDEDVEDEAEYTDTDLGAVEEHKSIILHLLSQLKLGMDLTKVRLSLCVSVCCLYRALSLRFVTPSCAFVAC